MDRVSELPGWVHVYSGKVRDLFVPAGADGLDDTDSVLVVASDRVSAFDHALEPGIPGKGELLTTLSLWWFDQLDDVPNHLIPDHTLAGERVVERIPRPSGLRNGDRLPEPIYTPAWKAPLGQHDENISFERTVELVGADVAEELRRASLHVYERGSAIAEARGVIIADTKFEFGADRTTGEITLADEVLTSDSSRYWDAAAYAAGSTPEERMASFDKQIVRDWLAANWDKTGTPPELPADIVE